MPQKKIWLLSGILLFSVIINVVLYRQTQDSFKPNQDKYNELFSGIEIDPIQGPPLDQLFARSFIFLTKSPEGRYDLSVISRNRCIGRYSGFTLDQEAAKQWDAYVEKPILIKEYTVKNEQPLVLTKIEIDHFTDARLPLLKEACYTIF